MYSRQLQVARGDGESNLERNRDQREDPEKE